MLICLACGTASAADITLLGIASFPGDARDKSGMTGTLAEGTPHDRLGSFGSAIAYAGIGGRYIAMDDRGPADGATVFHARFQTLDITVTPGATPAVHAELAATTMLVAENGQPLIGSERAPDAGKPDLRLDAEGVRVSLSGTLFVSEEYGPSIDEFSMDGKRLRRFAGLFDPSVDPQKVRRPHRVSQPNRGPEGLAISPDGSTLFAITQSPLVRDGGNAGESGRAGTNIRLVEFRFATGARREFLYPLEDPEYGVNELLAINDHEFLVIERDSKAGGEAKFRALYRIDIANATDIRDIASLPANGVPDGVKPATKSRFLDFLDPRFALAGPTMPEKIEGLTFGPDLPDGRRLLIVTTDNDFRAAAPTHIWAFAVDPADLPGLEHQRLAPKAPKTPKP